MRQINLLPQEIQKTRERHLFILSLAITVSLIVLIITVWHLLLNINIRRLESISSRLTPAVTIKNKFETLKKEFAQTAAEREKFLQDNSALMPVIRSRIPYSDLLKALSHTTYEKVWLNEFKLESRSGVLELSGSSDNTESVSEFLYRLRRIPFLASVAPSAIERGENDIINFKVRCMLR